jgi:hypothetical protein
LPHHGNPRMVIIKIQTLYTHLLTSELQFLKHEYFYNC